VTEKITLTKKQLDAMSPEQLTDLLMKAQKVEATAVVIGKDGRIRYDNPELAGTYGEQYLKEATHG
jgi:hypothetical protein